MNLDDRAIQRDHLQFDLDKLLLLETGKEPVEHSGFAPPIHARVDGVPVPEAFG